MFVVLNNFFRINCNVWLKFACLSYIKLIITYSRLLFCCTTVTRNYYIRMKNCAVDDIREESLAWRTGVDCAGKHVRYCRQNFSCCIVRQTHFLGYTTLKREHARCAELYPSRAIKQTKLNYVTVRNS